MALENSSSYPAPEGGARSLKEILEEATRDPAYASFLRDTVRDARTAVTVEDQQEALQTLGAHFALSGEELTLLNLPANFMTGSCRICTQTRPTLYLLDFATAFARLSPGESAQ
ncbi:MAG: hypothetical protein ABI946_03370 [Chthoniobacterales bacterium]